jgi:curved DNA-binding protein
MSVEFKDYYAILGVPRDAAADEIKKAFRKRARRHHPDVAKDKHAAEERFKEINEAYEVLGDPEKRGRYDRLGADWRQEGGSPATGRGGGFHEFDFGGTGFSDFFEQYFGGAGMHGFSSGMRGAARGGARRAAKGNDIEGDILVTLEEVMHGALRPVSMRTTDPHSGRVESHTFQVRIPPGVPHGKRIRVPGQGGPGSGGAGAGDLYLRVRHAAHPDFTTEGADLHHELELAPWEAVLGADVTVPTLDGSLKLRIPPGSENGRTLRVRGRGLPTGKSAARGDLLVTLVIQVPAHPGAEERALWEKLRNGSHFNPRARPQV